MNEQTNPTFDDHIQNVDAQASAALQAIDELKKHEKEALGSIPKWTAQAQFCAGVSWLLVLSACSGISILFIPFSSIFGAFQAFRVLTATSSMDITVYKKRARTAFVLVLIPFALFVAYLLNLWLNENK